MQYLVHVKGNVLDSCSKSYVVNAKSETDARNSASELFEGEFGVFEGNIYTQPYKRLKKSILAFVFILIPILLSLINWKNGHNTYSICPSLISCLYAVAFYATFVIRFKGIHRAVGSWIDITFCILMILLLSSFIQTILVEKTINLFWITEFNIDTKIILPIAIILSMFGLKIVSLICIASIGIMALFNITALSDAMGMVFGPLYIICAFMGIMLYLSVEPAMNEIMFQCKKSMIRTVDYTRSDLLQVKESIRNLKTLSQQEKLEEHPKEETCTN